MARPITARLPGATSAVVRMPLGLSSELSFAMYPFRPSWRTLALSFSLLGFLAAAAVSPIALTFVNRAFTENWVALGNIGQSYGGIAALISALALAGVAASLINQFEQFRLARLQNARSLQVELMRLRMTDASLLADFSTTAGLSPNDYKIRIYLNLCLKHIEVGYVTGAFGKSSVQHQVASLLTSSPAALEFWTATRETYLADAASSRERRFVTIVETAYHSTCSNQPFKDDKTLAPPWPEITKTESGERLRRRSAALAVGGGIATAGTVVLTRMTRRWLAHRNLR